VPRRPGTPPRVPPHLPPERSSGRRREEEDEEKSRSRIKLGTSRREEKRESGNFNGAIAWRQGIGFWVFEAPYRDEDLAFHPGKKPPAGVRVVSSSKRAYDTIQLVTGKPPAKPVTIDMGITDIEVSKPGHQPGKTGIKFTADPLQRTKGDITVKREVPNLARAGKSPSLAKGGNISRKEGRIFVTSAKEGKMYSRRPLRGRRT
jgi:hypothetical protein